MSLSSVLLPAFQFHLNQQVHGATVGKFDGQTPSLALSTTGGRVLLHSPHEHSIDGRAGLPSVRYLNFNRSITSLAAGKCNGRLKKKGGWRRVVYISYVSPQFRTHLTT